MMVFFNSQGTEIPGIYRTPPVSMFLQTIWFIRCQRNKQKSSLKFLKKMEKQVAKSVKKDMKKQIALNRLCIFGQMMFFLRVLSRRNGVGRLQGPAGRTEAQLVGNLR